MPLEFSNKKLGFCGAEGEEWREECIDTSFLQFGCGLIMDESDRQHKNPTLDLNVTKRDNQMIGMCFLMEQLNLAHKIYLPEN